MGGGSPTRRGRHVAQRTCVGCRQSVPKREAVRIVRTPQGVVIDHTGKVAGRGAYIHPLLSCWQAALKGPLARALKTVLTADERRNLEEYAQSMYGEA
jgi:predicted RNA-binding protein YlxR (DUF448 family)